MDKLFVAAVQLCSKQNREEILARARELMEEAVRRGAKLIALPENLSFLGTERDKVAVAEDLETGPSVEFLRSFAVEHRVAVVGGTIPLKTTNASRITNTCLVFDSSGELVGRYDKMHMFDVRVDEANTFIESEYVEAGDRVTTVELFGHTMGLSICYDLRFPELYRSLALRGAQALFVPAAFTRETGRDHWEPLLRARAIENLCYVVAPGQWGEHGEGRVSYGRSMIIGPWGQILAQCQDGEGVITCELDFDALKNARRRIPSLQHVRLRTLD